MADETLYYTSEPFGRSLGVSDLMLRIKGEAQLSRGIICRCYAGQYWSVTARSTEHDAGTIPGTIEELERPDKSGYLTPGKLEMWPGDRQDKWRDQNEQFVQGIWNLIAQGHGIPARGIIVVAGQTASRKTTYARIIARRCLENAIPHSAEDDRPHVVTYEDPIESWFAYSPAEASAAGFEYTPRQKKIDVRNLTTAVNDALRQKPALLYVNEVRNPGDWKALLDYAGTGHLAITTTHAGSVVETFERILTAAEASSAAHRSAVASRIVSVLHVRQVDNQPLPALWVQTPRSRTALTLEGLASLLPTGKDDGRCGREFFARLQERDKDIVRMAVQWDLAGE